MKYNYRGKNIVLDEALVKDYEDMNGAPVTELDITCALQSAGIDPMYASEDELQKAVAASMKAEIDVWKGIS